MLTQSLDRTIPEAVAALPDGGAVSQPLWRVLNDLQTLLRGDAPAESFAVDADWFKAVREGRTRGPLRRRRVPRPGHPTV